MASEGGGDAGGSIELVGHIVTYLSAVGTGFFGGKVKDLVHDVNSALSDIDEAATLAERQLRLHHRGEKDPTGLVGVFTARSNLGLLIDRHFGRRYQNVVSGLATFSTALDKCDPESTDGVAYGCDAEAAIQEVRVAQRILRRAIRATFKGKIARMVGRKAADAK
ncbi:hypothetical protein [uncultured Brevundimonas sp.]|uniref:hypothetical protein n=1 Tax=uncultured Brevundimonas sp. TaxID=213418 RepID=UPI0025DAA421|nr:hypothetical protein [uncultured Brevundimonas sp.]